MSKLTREEIGFLRLVQRSPNDGDGWRSVGKMLWPIVIGFKRPELIETEALPDGMGRVRFSERGEIVLSYL